MKKVDDDLAQLVISGGVAGLASGMYVAKSGLRAVIIDQMMSGNQIINVESIEGFPGFPEVASGGELGLLIQGQAMTAGAKCLIGEVTQVSLNGQH